MENRRRAYGGSAVEILQWVGANSSDNTKSVEFNLNINLRSTMSFSCDVHVCGRQWISIVVAAASSKPTWANDKNQLQVYYNNSGNYDLLYFSTQTLFQTGTGPVLSRHTFSFDGGFLIDGVRKTTVSNPQTVVSGGSIWVRGYKVYGFKLWDNGTLIRDYAPALKSGVFGLYDNVTNTFLTPSLASSGITGEV